MAMGRRPSHAADEVAQTAAPGPRATTSPLPTRTRPAAMQALAAVHVRRWRAHAGAPLSRFPPHTRGWTLFVGWFRNGPSVSPAHAGMDLRGCAMQCCSFGFPRTRGDGPLFRRPDQPGLQFPPHTRGWTLIKAVRAILRSVSGDGPRIHPATKAPTPFPPHTRGWTRCRRDWVRLADVSPAHAGMDPSGTSCGRSTGSFPRTRGDGPCCV